MNKLDRYDSFAIAKAIRKGTQVREGHWTKEETEYGWDGRSYQCSVCGRSIHTDTVMEDVKLDYPYCHCGARMRVKE